MRLKLIRSLTGIVMLAVLVSSCAYRMYKPAYMTEWHFEQMIAGMADRFFELNPQVGTRIVIDSTSEYGELVSAEFRAKGYEVEESTNGYRLEIYPYESDDRDDSYLMVASLNKRNGDRFNVLFRVLDDRVIANKTSVQRL